jgi:hypothetical protein
MVIRSVLLLYAYFAPLELYSQTVNDTITKLRVLQTISYIASDELKGRVNYTKEQVDAAHYLAGEFKNSGLKPFTGYQNFFQPFSTTINSASGNVVVACNGTLKPDSSYCFFSRPGETKELALDDFIVMKLYPPLASSILLNNWNNSENILFQIILPDSIQFSDVVSELQLPYGAPSSNILIIDFEENLETIEVKPDMKRLNNVLYNIIGMIPGKSRPDEAIIFSAHYDHVDQGILGDGSEIFNGANDNASGTTAVLELARYFSLRADNERTIIFCLFAGEEIGMLGSFFFSSKVKPENIKAVINIEMIGRTNIGGKNRMMLTGSGYSDLYTILKKNLKREIVGIMEHIADPTNLFGRSDNYPFALRGITAHTIMCSDDRDPCYHLPCDDVRRIDIDNMARIIRAIAKSASTLISGIDTPSPVRL